MSQLNTDSSTLVNNAATICAVLSSIAYQHNIVGELIFHTSMGLILASNTNLTNASFTSSHEELVHNASDVMSTYKDSVHSHPILINSTPLPGMIVSNIKLSFLRPFATNFPSSYLHASVPSSPSDLSTVNTLTNSLVQIDKNSNMDICSCDPKLVAGFCNGVSCIHNANSILHRFKNVCLNNVVVYFTCTLRKSLSSLTNGVYSAGHAINHHSIYMLSSSGTHYSDVYSCIHKHISNPTSSLLDIASVCRSLNGKDEYSDVFSVMNTNLAVLTLENNTSTSSASDLMGTPSMFTNNMNMSLGFSAQQDSGSRQLGVSPSLNPSQPSLLSTSHSHSPLIHSTSASSPYSLASPLRIDLNTDMSPRNQTTGNQWLSLPYIDERKNTDWFSPPSNHQWNTSNVSSTKSAKQGSDFDSEKVTSGLMNGSSLGVNAGMSTSMNGMNLSPSLGMNNMGNVNQLNANAMQFNGFNSINTNMNSPMNMNMNMMGSSLATTPIMSDINGVLNNNSVNSHNTMMMMNYNSQLDQPQQYQCQLQQTIQQQQLQLQRLQQAVDANNNKFHMNHNSMMSSHYNNNTNTNINGNNNGHGNMFMMQNMSGMQMNSMNMGNNMSNIPSPLHSTMHGSLNTSLNGSLSLQNMNSPNMNVGLMNTNVTPTNRMMNGNQSMMYNTHMKTDMNNNMNSMPHNMNMNMGMNMGMNANNHGMNNNMMKMNTPIHNNNRNTPAMMNQMPNLNMGMQSPHQPSQLSNRSLQQHNQVLSPSNMNNNTPSSQVDPVSQVLMISATAPIQAVNLVLLDQALCASQTLLSDFSRSQPGSRLVQLRLLNSTNTIQSRTNSSQSPSDSMTPSKGGRKNTPFTFGFDQAESKTTQQIDSKYMTFLCTHLIPHMKDLMLNLFGNYLIQRLIPLCSRVQRYRLLMVISHEFKTIAIDKQGTRAIQKLCEYSDCDEERYFMLANLRGYQHGDGGGSFGVGSYYTCTCQDKTKKLNSDVVDQKKTKCQCQCQCMCNCVGKQPIDRSVPPLRFHSYNEASQQYKSSLDHNFVSSFHPEHMPGYSNGRIFQRRNNESVLNNLIMEYVMCQLIKNNPFGHISHLSKQQVNAMGYVYEERAMSMVQLICKYDKPVDATQCYVIDCATLSIQAEPLTSTTQLTAFSDVVSVFCLPAYSPSVTSLLASYSSIESLQSYLQQPTVPNPTVVSNSAFSLATITISGEVLNAIKHANVDPHTMGVTTSRVAVTLELLYPVPDSLRSGGLNTDVGVHVNRLQGTTYTQYVHPTSMNLGGKKHKSTTPRFVASALNNNSNAAIALVSAQLLNNNNNIDQYSQLRDIITYDSFSFEKMPPMDISLGVYHGKPDEPFEVEKNFGMVKCETTEEYKALYESDAYKQQHLFMPTNNIDKCGKCSPHNYMYPCQEVQSLMLELMTSGNGAHVILSILDTFPLHMILTSGILHVCYRLLHSIAVDQHGVVLIKKLIAIVPPQIFLLFARKTLAEERVCIDLSNNQYGNYYIQHLLDRTCTDQESFQYLNMPLSSDVKNSSTPQSTTNNNATNNRRPVASSPSNAMGASHSPMNSATPNGNASVTESAVSTLTSSALMPQTKHHYIPSCVMLTKIRAESQLPYYKHKYESIQSQFVDIISGSIQSFARQKFGSNVVEKCLRACGPSIRDQILSLLTCVSHTHESTCAPSSSIVNDQHLFMLTPLQRITLLANDAYGSYVLQNCIPLCSPVQVNMIMKAVNVELPGMRRHMKKRWEQVIETHHEVIAHCQRVMLKP